MAAVSHCSQSWNPLNSIVLSKWWWICTYIQLMSSTYWLPFRSYSWGMSPITSTTGEINRTKRRRPRTEPCGTPVSEVSQEDEESILTKDERFVKVWPGCGQFLTSQIACEGGWCGPECQKQPTSRAAPYQNQWRPWYVSRVFLLSNRLKGWKLGEMERWGRRRKAKRSNILPWCSDWKYLKFEGSDLESPGFFRRGVMRACLSCWWKSALGQPLARWDMRIENVRMSLSNLETCGDDLLSSWAILSPRPGTGQTWEQREMEGHQVWRYGK